MNITKIAIVGVALVLAAYAALADNSLTAPYGFSISSPTISTLTITASDSNDIAPDSLSVIAYDDSVWYGYIEYAASVDTTLINLTPATRYILGLRQVRGDSVTLSNKDTLYTNRVQIEDVRSVGAMTNMRGARTDRNTPVYWDTLYVSTSSGYDSTMVYRRAPYMGISAYVNGNADSSKVKLFIMPGYGEETNTVRETTDTRTGTWDFSYAATDSINITRAGWSPIYQPMLPPTEHFYIRADGQTGNGNATQVIIRLYRRWFEMEN
jgi:hypothetical protein